jgi:pantoate--beta-alanine ligase
MGALHEGHAALIRAAKKLSPSVVVSIFVNPLQFENEHDLAQYPVTLEADRKLATDSGAAFVWAPTYQEVYKGEINKISAGDLGQRYEGHSRPGHFDGVLTVVKRLFEAVDPAKAIFGEKDYQQLFLIKQMVKKLALEVEIISHPTIRDLDGVALSSRNSRLSKEGRIAARVIRRALLAARNSSQPVVTMKEVLANEPRFSLDYAVVINEEDFSSIEDGSHSESARALIAGWIDGVRLIDNMNLRLQAISGEASK